MDGYFSTFFCAITKKEDTCGAPYSKDEKIEFSFDFLALKTAVPTKRSGSIYLSLPYRHFDYFCDKTNEGIKDCYHVCLRL